MDMATNDMSEYMVTSRKYANKCSYFDSTFPKSIIKHMFLVISITQKVYIVYKRYC